MTEIFRYPPSSSHSPSAFSWASAFTLFPKTPPARKGQVSRISHPPQSSLQLCCDPVPQHHTLGERLPKQNKGIKNELCSHQETRSPLKQKTVRSDESQLWVFIFFPPLYISGSFHSLLRIMPFLINAQRHDLDSRGNSIMCAQVHVWEVSAWFFNVAFYLNECSRAPKKMCTFILQADMLSRKAPYTTLYVYLFSHMSVVL